MVTHVTAPRLRLRQVAGSGPGRPGRNRHRKGQRWAPTNGFGVNSGPAIAGIIGTHKFSHDLWGDTVNVAARLEQHGTPGRIHVSAETARLLAPRYRLTPRGPIAIKGHATIDTSFLDGRRLA